MSPFGETTDTTAGSVSPFLGTSAIVHAHASEEFSDTSYTPGESCFASAVSARHDDGPPLRTAPMLNSERPYPVTSVHAAGTSPGTWAKPATVPSAQACW